MVDHFTRDELLHMQFAIVSAKVANQGRIQNCVKLNNLYPTTDIVMAYDDNPDQEILDKMMFKMYDDMIEVKDVRIFYDAFLNAMVHHQDVVILCAQRENPYITSLCRYLKKKFDIEVVDLNQLFTEGRVGSVYLDRDKIYDHAVDMRRIAVSEQKAALATTVDGREKLLGMMTKREKLDKLKELGIRINKSDRGKLDQLLREAWVNEDD
jgi:hypothetical protein